MTRISISCVCAAAVVVGAVGVAGRPSARSCGGDMLSKADLVKRQRTTTWQSAATDTDATTECSPYSYAPVQAMLRSYPTIWQIANLSFAGVDPAATALYQKILPSIPNIAVKGTPDGNFSSFTPTYPATDPDCWWSYHQCTTPKLAGLANDVTECPEPNTWGFTLDDGPNCSHNAYYDFLQERNQKATLFYIGSNVFDWPLEAQRGLGDGHEIGCHTWSHRYMTALTNEQAFAELYFSKKAIKDVIGITVQSWRPPFGDVDDRIRYIAQALGMQTIIWNEDVNDFRIAQLGQAAINANYQSLISGVANGSYNDHGIIVLSHELYNATMATSEAFLPQIQSTFKQVTPVAVCMNNSQPYEEGSAYIYPNFEQWANGARNGTLAAPSASALADIVVPSATSGGSVSATVTYASAANTNGVSNAPTGGSTTAGGSGASSSSGSSSSSSGGSTSSSTKSAATRQSGLTYGSVLALVSLGAGALFVL